MKITTLIAAAALLAGATLTANTAASAQEFSRHHHFMRHSHSSSWNNDIHRGGPGPRVQAGSGMGVGGVR